MRRRMTSGGNAVRDRRPVSSSLMLAPVVALSTIGAVLMASTQPAAAAPSPITAVEVERVAGTTKVTTTVGDPCNTTHVGACNAQVTMNYGSGDRLWLTGFSAGGEEFRVLDGRSDGSYVEVYRVEPSGLRCP